MRRSQVLSQYSVKSNNGINTPNSEGTPQRNNQGRSNANTAHLHSVYGGTDDDELMEELNVPKIQEPVPPRAGSPMGMALPVAGCEFHSWIQWLSLEIKVKH